jgi:predicted  nucleic acid-binding Zn-ribbon protein
MKKHDDRLSSQEAEQSKCRKEVQDLRAELEAVTLEHRENLEEIQSRTQAQIDQLARDIQSKTDDLCDEV